MKQKIIYWIAVVVGAYVVKDILLPIVAALLATGPKSVTMMSYAVGAIFTVCGVYGIASAAKKRDICMFGFSAKMLAFGIILLAA